MDSDLRLRGPRTPSMIRSHTSGPGHRPDADGAIRQTDTDAALARLSAVQKGYLSDAFVNALVPRAHLQPPRPPLINVGTFVRTRALDELVEGWIVRARAAGTRCQIVSFGAGSDTRFWRLATGEYSDQIASYVELDFADNTMKKAMAIRKSKELSAVLGGADQIHIANGGTALHAPVYHLLPADLRLPPATSLGPLLFGAPAPALARALPTLLLFECVLAYIPPAASRALLAWFVDALGAGAEVAARTPGADAGAAPGAGTDTEAGGSGGARPPAPLGAVVYEMFGLGDAFGRVMLANLKTRDVSLPGVAPYPDTASLPQRFTALGFSAARALTLRQIRHEYVGAAELQRISRLEMLDEVEELDLVLEHYAITWGVKVPEGEGDAWLDWGLKVKTETDEDEE